MYLVLFLYIAAFFSLILGEFGQFPFGRTDFSVSATDMLLTLALSAALIWNVGIRKSLILPRNFIYLMIFWAVCILSLFFSLDLSGWFYLIRFIIYSSTFYLTFSLVKSRILGLGEFLTLVKVTGVALAVIGLFQLIVFPDLETLTALGFDPHKFRIFSTFLDPNFLGAFLNFGFGLVIFELISKKISGSKKYVQDNKWSIISAVILGTAIFLTFSRSAYLMFIIMLMIILVVKSIKLLGIFFVSLIILYLIFPPFSARIQGAINIDKSAIERFSSWDKGLTIFQNNPILGVGFNNIRKYSQQMNLTKLFSADGGNSGAGIDSSLIFILATTGLVGFLTFILLIIKVLSDLILSLTTNFKDLYNLQFRPFRIMKTILKLPVLEKWHKDNYVNLYKIEPNYLSLPLFALTLALMANSFFINSLFFPQVMFIWYSLLGVYFAPPNELL